MIITSGRSLYVVDNPTYGTNADGKVFKYILADTGAIYNFNWQHTLQSNRDPRGIAIKGDSMYITDRENYVFVYHRENRSYQTKYRLPANNADAQGITFGNDAFWIVDRSDKKVYKYPTFKTVEEVTTNYYSVTTNQTKTLSFPITTGADDVTEHTNDGRVSLSRTDTILGKHRLGLRFNVDLLAGAEIVDAYIQFTSVHSEPDPVRVEIYGHRYGHAPCFATNAGNVSLRPKTSASTSWNIPW